MHCHPVRVSQPANMFKRFWWVFLVIACTGSFMWMAAAKVGPKKDEPGASSNQESSLDRPEARNSNMAIEEPRNDNARESSRHSTGEVKRHQIERHQAEERRLEHLEKAVKAQEEKVEERRKALATIVRTKGIIYKGADADSANTEIQEDTTKKALDVQEYADAKREFETEQKSLQEMKLKQIYELMESKQGIR
jgi:hypothetical protein